MRPSHEPRLWQVAGVFRTVFLLSLQGFLLSVEECLDARSERGCASTLALSRKLLSLEEPMGESPKKPQEEVERVEQVNAWRAGKQVTLLHAL